MKIKVDHLNKLPDSMLTGKEEDYRPQFILQEKFFFSIEINNKKAKFKIPEGFLFDYGSIPRFAASIIPPIEIETANPYLIHDWLYSGEYFDRKFCDDVLLAALKFNGNSSFKSYIIYWAVRIGGGKAFKHSKKHLKIVRSLSGFSNFNSSPLWDWKRYFK